MGFHPNVLSYPRLLAGTQTISAGIRWSGVPDSLSPDVEWIDNRGSPAEHALPTIDPVPIPSILCYGFLSTRGSSARLEANA
jgi:hypothetical protein